MDGLVRLFKDDLKNIRILLNELDELEERLDTIQYIMNGVSGLDPSKEISSNAFPTSGNNVIANMKEKEMIIKKIESYRSRVEFVNEVLSHMSAEDKSMVIDIYVLGKKFIDLAKDNNYSERSMKYYIDKKIKFALSTIKNSAIMIE